MRNQQYESALTRQGLEWEYLEKVLLKEINLKRGLSNQARLTQAIDPELLAAYQLALASGATFPPVVLWRTSNNALWIPADDNHRLRIYSDAGVKSTDAYCLTTHDPLIADRVTWTFNNHVNGKRLGADECLAHAQTFVRKYGYTMENAAKEWGIPRWKLRDSLQIIEAHESLDRQNVKRKPPDDTIRTIAPLANLGEDVLAKAAVMVAENGIDRDMAITLVQEVRAAKTHDAKLEAIETFSQKEEVKLRRAETKNGHILPKKPTPRARLQRLLRDLLNLFENFPDKAALKPQGQEYKEAREDAKEACNLLIALFGLGAKL